MIQLLYSLALMFLMVVPCSAATTSLACSSTAALIVPTPGTLYTVDNCGVTGDIVFASQSWNISLRITNSTVRKIAFLGDALNVSVGLIDSRTSAGGQIFFSQNVTNATIDILGTNLTLMYPSAPLLRPWEQQFIVCNNSNSSIRDVKITLSNTTVYFGFDNVSLFLFYNGFAMNTASSLLYIEGATVERVRVLVDGNSVVNHTASQGRTIWINSVSSSDITAELRLATVQTPCLVSLISSSSNSSSDTAAATVSVVQSYVTLSSVQEVSSIIRVEGSNGSGRLAVMVAESTVVGLVLSQGLGRQEWYALYCPNLVVVGPSLRAAVVVEVSDASVLSMTGVVAVFAVREGSVAVALTNVRMTLTAGGQSLPIPRGVINILNQTLLGDALAVVRISARNCTAFVDALTVMRPNNGSLLWSSGVSPGAALQLDVALSGSNVTLQYALCDLRQWSPLFAPPLLSINITVGSSSQLLMTAATAPFGSSLAALGSSKLINSTVILSASSLYYDGIGIVNASLQRQSIVATLGDVMNVSIVIANKTAVRLQGGYVMMVGGNSTKSTISVLSQSRIVGVQAMLFVGGDSTDDSIELRQTSEVADISPFGGSLMSLGCASCFVVSPSVVIAHGSSISIGASVRLDRDVLLLRFATNSTVVFPSVLFDNVTLVSAFDAVNGTFDWRPMGNSSNIWSAQLVWRRVTITTVVIVEAPTLQKTLFIASTQGLQGDTLVAIENTAWMVTCNNTTARQRAFNISLIEIGYMGSLNATVTSVVVNISNSSWNVSLAVVAPGQSSGPVNTASSATLRLAMTNMDLGGPGANYTLMNVISIPVVAIVVVTIDAVTLHISNNSILTFRLQEGLVHLMFSVSRSRIVGTGGAAAVTLLRGGYTTNVNYSISCFQTDVYGVTVIVASSHDFIVMDNALPLRVAGGTILFDGSALRETTIGRMRNVVDGNIAVALRNTSVMNTLTELLVVAENAVNTVLSLTIEGTSNVSFSFGLVGLISTLNVSVAVSISGGIVSSAGGGGGLLYLCNATASRGGLTISSGQSVVLDGPLLVMMNSSSLRSILKGSAVVVGGSSQVVARSVVGLSSGSVLSSVEVGGFSRVVVTSGCFLDIAGNSTVNRTEIGPSWVTLAASPGDSGVLCGQQMGVPALPMVLILNRTSVVAYGEGHLVSMSTPDAVAQQLQFTLCRTLLNGSDWRRDARASFLGGVVTCSTDTQTNGLHWTTESISASINRSQSPSESQSLTASASSTTTSSMSLSASLSPSHSDGDSGEVHFRRPSESLSLTSVSYDAVGGGSTLSFTASLSITTVSSSESPTASNTISASPSPSLSSQWGVPPPPPTTPVPTTFVNANSTLLLVVNGTASATSIAFAIQSAFALSTLPTVVIVSDSGANRTLLVMFTDPASRDDALLELTNASSTAVKALRAFVLSAAAVYPVVAPTAAPSDAPLSGGMSEGTVAAIVLGVVMAVAAGVALGCFCWRKQASPTAKSIADIEMVEDSPTLPNSKDTPALLLQDDPVPREVSVVPGEKTIKKKKKKKSPMEATPQRIALPAEGAEHIPDWVPLDQPMIVAADDCVEDAVGFYDEDGYYHYYLEE